ncbi:MAG: allantoinase AllB [Polyangiaceae bacterium]|nr:allantoinase AllB [Polyangiaceae bacterium]
MMTVFRSRRVLLEGGLSPACVHVQDGKITDITSHETPGNPAQLVDVGDLLLTPGVVDSHVHINEPGRTEWEGFKTATEAAAAGGITTVVDMPLNCIPATTSRSAAEEKLESLRDQLSVDVAFWGGVIPGNTRELAGLAEFGVPGAKCFLCPSGVDEFPHVSRADLDLAMPVLRDLGLTLLVHAENPGPLEAAEKALELEKANPADYSTYLRSRPPAAEDEAIAMVIDLCAKHHCPAHIVHLSSASAIPMITAAHAQGVPITVETCLHYLTFSSEEVPPGRTEYKCAPPIRDQQNRELLWKGLENKAIAMVVSDHSPCTPVLKKPDTGDFMGAWGGIAGLQFGLSVLWTHAASRGIALSTMFEWNALAPARLAGLSHRKGRIAKGYDADLVVWDDAASFTVESTSVRHRHKVTPYSGRSFKGVVHQTWVRGSLAYHRDTGLAQSPRGTFVARDR